MRDLKAGGRLIGYLSLTDRRATPGRRSALALLLTALSAASPLSAQVVTGGVFDQQTDSVIDGVEVLLLDRDDNEVLARAATGPDGRFALRAPLPGIFLIRSTRLGYQSVSVPDIDLLRADSLDIELRMSVDAVPLAPLTVVARRASEAFDARLERRGYYDRRARYGKRGNGMGFATFLEAEDIRDSALDIEDVLRDISGIHVTWRGRQAIVTGRKGCRVSLFIDGTRVRNSSPSEWVSPSSVVAVEVYPGHMVPLEYVTLEPPCGAISIWTGARRW